MTLRVIPFLLATAAFAQTGTWAPFARLRDARFDACAIRVAPGQILITGGAGAGGPLSSAEILRADGTVTPAASMKTARTRHTCTLLADGRVLVTGGAPGAELYDPAADAWTSIAGRARSGATATLMPDGRVLVAGGYDGDGPLALLEMFDPAANTLGATAAQLREPRRGHAAALLGDGRVALIGGNNSSGPLHSTEIFTGVSGAVTAGPDLNFARTLHSATTLEDGRVLVAGGIARGVELNTAEVLDTAGQSWTLLLSRLGIARSGHFAVLVPGNGGVVLGGGSYQGQALAITEIFQPGDETFRFLGNLTAPRSGLAGAPLDDGVLLAMGGANATGPQSGCGILNLVSLSFSSPVYHPGQIVTASGNNLPEGTQVTLTLELVQNGSVTPIQTRLITRSVTTSSGSSKLQLGGFGPVDIVAAQTADAGGQFRLAARFGTSSVARSVPVKVVTTLAIPVPNSVLEGQSATFEVDVRRILPPGPLLGTVTATIGTSTSAVLVNGSGSPVVARFTRTNLPVGPLPITASYSGDALNDASTASATFTVVSRTPIVELTSSLDSPRVGTPFSLFARVRVDGNVPGGPPITGAVTILESGVPIGAATLVTSLTTPTPNILTSRSFTALSFAPLRFTASFAGDSDYRAATSVTISPIVQKAQPTLSILPAPAIFGDTLVVGQPAVFQCGALTTFNARLIFPPTIGLSDRTFSLSVNAADASSPTISIGDGSVRLVSGAANGTLTPSAAQLGTAQGTGSIVVPFNSISVTATFPGDTFFNPATATLPLVMQPLPMKVEFSSLPATAVNPLTLVVTVSNDGTSTCRVSGPEGTVEFFDGTTSLGIVQLPANTTTPNQINDGTSNTIQLSESGKQARLTVSRPVGVHNLKARYSGDKLHAAAETAVVAVTFQ